LLLSQLNRCTLVALLVVSAASAQQPVVTKVEPPNWWAGHTINPVRLLVRGHDLQGASVKGPRGIRASRVKVNVRGTYLFVDIEIPEKIKPGSYPLNIITKAGTAVIPFRIDETLPAKEYFRGFTNDDVIYLVMPDRFADGDRSNDDPAASRGLLSRDRGRFYHGGDLQGIINHLAYLKDLGVTAIWMTPIYDGSNHLSAGEKYDGQPATGYHGYGAIDLYGIEEHFGSMDTVRKLVNEAHRYGIKVIQDQVENHVGEAHPWVADEPTPTWFHGKPSEHLPGSSQFWTIADPHASPSLKRPVLEGWFANILPDINQEDSEVVRYQIENTLWWLGAAGFDGIRQDTWPYVSRAFWRDWMRAIKKQYPKLTVVGEAFDSDPALVSFFQGGRTQWDGIDDLVDSVFDFPLFSKLRASLASGAPLSAVPDVLARDYLYPNPDRLVTFIGLHDVPRFMNEPHASIDNLKLAFTCLLTTRGIPMIYYGDEIGMRGGKDPDNRRDFPGGWAGDAQNAFEESGRTREQQDVFRHVRRLTHLRSKLECLRRGTTVTLLADDGLWAYARVTKKEMAVVVVNTGDGPGQVKIELSDLGIPSLSKWTPQLGSGSEPAISAGTAWITLAPRTAEVYEVTGGF
jgi:glycosidase